MSAPIGNTCPDINSLIASIKEAHGHLITATDTLDQEQNKEQINNIEEAMGILAPLFNEYRNPIEELRDSNHTLREYGEKWENKASDFEWELGKANDRISELENEIEELKSQVQ